MYLLIILVEKTLNIMIYIHDEASDLIKNKELELKPPLHKTNARYY